MHFHVELNQMDTAQLVELFDQAPVGICVLAVPSLSVVAANREYAAQMGLSDPSLLIGTDAWQHPSNGLTQGLLPIWRQVAITGKGLPAAEIQSRNGESVRFFDAQCAPLKHDDGSVCAIITTVLEVTERKRAEAALQAARREAEIAYAREHRIAASFQRALLPHGEIRVPGHTIAHTYRPALIEADVGGDFYNIFPIDEDHTGLVIGDIGGKGLSAAVIGAQVQHSITALALAKRRTPGAILNEIRSIVTTLEDPERLVTVFFGILNHTTGRFRYARAGHEPAWLWRAKRHRPTPLLPRGSAICIAPASPCATGETFLTPEDLLLLHTDGLTDARPRPGTPVMGWERIADLLAEHHDKEPAEIVEALYQAAVRYSEGHLRDDMALIAIRRQSADCAGPAAKFVPLPAIDHRLFTRS